MHGNRQQMFLVALAIVLLLSPVLSVSAFGSSDSKTLDRNADPAIVAGVKLPELIGKPLSQLFVYRYLNSQWQQIPWQFDEVVNGEYVASDNLQLDEADELVVMARDCGDRAEIDQWIDDTYSRANPRYEIEIIDPLNTSHTGWLYVYHSPTLSAANTEDYVDYDYSTSVFTTPVYTLGFYPQYIAGNRLELNGSGVNVLDHSKWRFKTVGIDSVWNHESIEVVDPQPEILDGKVRAIAGYQGSGQGLLTVAYRSQFFDLFNLDLSFSPNDLEWVVTSADFNENIIGGVYYDANTPAGVVVDGAPDSVASSPATQWQQISSATGTVFHAIEAARMQGVQSTYYKDNSNIDPNDTGDQKSYGDMGITITNPIKAIDGSLTHYILPPNEPNVGAMYYGYFTNPLQVQAIEQRYSPDDIPGDVNGDGLVDLKDAVVALKVMGGMDAANLNIGADVDGDLKIGMAEVIYVLQAAFTNL